MKYNFTYYFPSIPVVVTALPKTGCTSLKNFLFAVELSLQASASDNGASHRTSSLLYPADPSDIHWRVPVDQFLVSAATEIPTGTPVVSVLRDPLDRVISCWTDKFLFAQDVDYYRHFGAEKWFPDPHDGPGGAEASLYEFMCLIRDSESFRTADPHWTPQVEMLLPVQLYTALIMTDDLDGLPGLIPGLAEKFQGMELTMPHFHPSPEVNIEWLSTRRVVEAAKAAYSSDYALLAAHEQLATSQSAPFEAAPIDEDWQAIAKIALKNREQWL